MEGLVVLCISVGTRFARSGLHFEKAMGLQDMNRVRVNSFQEYG